MADDDRSKVLTNDEFGYWTITVERPLRLNFACTPERIDRALAAKPLKARRPGATPRAHSKRSAPRPTPTAKPSSRRSTRVLREHGVALTTPQRKALWLALGEHDDDADICLDKNGDPEPDPALRDTENVPFTYNGNTDGADGRDATIEAYFDAEVLPHVPDAWVDTAKTKVGYEIPFTRIFYKYQPPRTLEEIDADLEARIARVLDMLREVEQ